MPPGWDPGVSPHSARLGPETENNIILAPLFNRSKSQYTDFR